MHKLLSKQHTGVFELKKRSKRNGRNVGTVRRATVCRVTAKIVETPQLATLPNSAQRPYHKMR